ncbi:hypothetical protein B0H13DRAFT_1953532 [Mycena leptocephala]|nr:hypothetical protein B0H13DRAFT_1953532 [Mycena leptocephala]
MKWKTMLLLLDRVTQLSCRFRALLRTISDVRRYCCDSTSNHKQSLGAEYTTVDLLSKRGGKSVKPQYKRVPNSSYFPTQFVERHNLRLLRLHVFLLFLGRDSVVEENLDRRGWCRRRRDALGSRNIGRTLLHPHHEDQDQEQGEEDLKAAQDVQQHRAEILEQRVLQRHDVVEVPLLDEVVGAGGEGEDPADHAGLRGGCLGTSVGIGGDGRNRGLSGAILERDGSRGGAGAAKATEPLVCIAGQGTDIVDGPEEREGCKATRKCVSGPNEGGSDGGCLGIVEVDEKRSECDDGHEDGEDDKALDIGCGRD